MSLLQGWMEPIVPNTGSILRVCVWGVGGGPGPSPGSMPCEQGTFSVQGPPDTLETRFALGP